MDSWSKAMREGKPVKKKMQSREALNRTTKTLKVQDQIKKFGGKA